MTELGQGERGKVTQLADQPGHFSPSPLIHKQSTERVYLDYAATAPLRPEAFEAMLPWLAGGGFGNAGTLYSEGKAARQALDEARAAIAAAIGAAPTEIFFTSGGTESNNALLAGITAGVRQKSGRARGGNLLVTSAFEHHAVLEPLRALRRDGWLTELLTPTRAGFIEPVALDAELTKKAEQGEKATLVSIMAANNEIGTIQALAELSVVAHEHGALFFTDAVQALGHVDFDVRELGVDAASFSAHKLGGPKGSGAFYLKNLTPFVARQLGGGQERGLRSGTPDVASAVGFACALTLAVTERERETTRLAALRDQLAAGLLNLSECIQLTIDPRTDPDKHLPHLLSFMVRGFESETLIMKLDQAGFAVSGGSACSTGSLAPSHVLTALGIAREQAECVLRISLGEATEEEQIGAFLHALAELLSSG